MREELIETLGLQPHASDTEILKAVTELATERKRAQQSAAFEARVAELMRVTNSPRELAVKILAEQDSAT